MVIYCTVSVMKILNLVLNVVTNRSSASTMPLQCFRQAYTGHKWEKIGNLVSLVELDGVAKAHSVRNCLGLSHTDPRDNGLVRVRVGQHEIMYFILLK